VTASAPQPCAYCPHELATHRLLVLDTKRLLGIVLCGTPRCPCGATWRASTAPSTPEQITETRQAVRDIITNAGMPLPRFLQ
jgi:hypothetical protein